MTQRAFVAGANFSGRSKALMDMLRTSFGPRNFFVGPYAEAALSGLSSTVADEIALYRAPRTDGRAVYPGPAVGPQRKPQSLSGGEQVMLALHCFSLSGYATLAIDTALEQLDDANRSAALNYLDRGDFNAALIDNRSRPDGWPCRDLGRGDGAFACDWEALIADIVPARAPTIALDHMHFRYRTGPEIFRGVSLALVPGHAYRLLGANGAGKTTFLKILVGALAPSSGTLALDGAPYDPWRNGNRALALATQNPDQQWCGATLREDMNRRRAGLDAGGDAAALTDARLAMLARRLGVASLDQHLYELPLAARKRLSWLWPFAGIHPWIMLDEPTIGQDAATRGSLARAMTALCAAGRGLIFVTHDDEFAGRVPHTPLQVDSLTISAN